jgi:hypothetical protein
MTVFDSELSAALDAGLSSEISNCGKAYAV